MYQRWAAYYTLQRQEQGIGRTLRKCWVPAPAASTTVTCSTYLDTAPKYGHIIYHRTTCNKGNLLSRFKNKNREANDAHVEPNQNTIRTTTSQFKRKHRGAVAQCIRLPRLKSGSPKRPQKHSLPVQQPTAQCVQSSTAAKWSPSTAQSFVTIPPTAHGHSLTHCYTTLVSLSKLDPSFPLDDIVPSHLFLSPLKTKQNHTSFTSLYRSL